MMPAVLREIYNAAGLPLTGNAADNPMASGLGLGLSVVKQVVGKMGGKIDLMESAPPGYNTAFKVTLPLQ